MSTRCRFYYEDSHRRSAAAECRLIDLNPASEPWHEGLCKKCPVPKILEHNPCANLALEAEVRSRWRIFQTIDIFSVCTVKMEELSDPMTCRQGCAQFRSLL